VKLLLLLLTGLLVLLGLLLQPLWRSRQRARWRREPLPAAWRRVLRRRVPLVARLPADQQLRLRGLMQVLLREKRFVGCGGLVLSEEMRLVVAAQAALPLLGHTRGYYPNLREILLYPTAFAVGAAGDRRRRRAASAAPRAGR
jgi:Mlc titration factor MtfA (ptsG expression regulator)